MKLTYHEGNNFGDALNPIIFKHFFGESFFNDDETISFLAIGSILGLKKGRGKKIVFSSGYAAGDEHTYGAPPIIDDSYEIYCVRGKETAKLLNLPPDKAVTDGAILISDLPFENVKTKHEVSFIPHVYSLNFYSDFKKLCNQCGINFIDPREEVFKVIEEIRSSKLVLAEAMHGAIVADAFRVPWVPIQLYPQINNFKWKDWCSSLDIEYQPLISNVRLHDETFLQQVLKNKISVLPNVIAKAGGKIIIEYHKIKLRSFLKKAVESQQFLSNDSVFKDRKNKLLLLLQQIKSKYQPLREK